jgi:hypothetical protein
MYHHKQHILGHRDRYFGNEHDSLRYTAHRLPQTRQLAKAIRNQSTQGFGQSEWTGYHGNAWLYFTPAIAA